MAVVNNMTLRLVSNDDELLADLREMSRNALRGRHEELTRQLRYIVEGPNCEAVFYTMAVLGSWLALRASRENDQEYPDQHRIGAWCSALYPGIKKIAEGADYQYVYDRCRVMIGMHETPEPVDPATGQNSFTIDVQVGLAMFLYGANPWSDKAWELMVTDLKKRAELNDDV